MERSKRTKAEQEYVKALIQGLSLQRLTDLEIVDYLHNEKQIEIGRSTVTIIKNNIQKQAEKWYIELRQSRYKYIATYKQRIDSLLSYQKKLHAIISDSQKDEVKIRAISELHSIEMDLFSLWKQLPDLQIGDSRDNKDEYQYDNVGRNGLPRAISYGPEENDEHDRAVYFGWKQGDPPLDGCFRAMMEQKYGLEFEPWDELKWVDCPACKRWFKSEERLRMHAPICPEPII